MLFPFMQKTLPVLIGDQQRGVDFISGRAAGHIVDSFSLCAGCFRDGTHFAGNISFNIQLCG